MIYPASPPIRIFLVDDYQTVLWGLANLIKGEYPRMQLVGTASSRSETLSSVAQQRPHVVLLDNDLDGENTLCLLPQLVALGSHRILILTDQPCSPELTCQALALGACGALDKAAPAANILHAIEYVHREGIWPGQMALFN